MAVAIASCLSSHIIPTLFYVDTCIRLTVPIALIVHEYSHVAIMCNTYVLLTFARCAWDKGKKIFRRQRGNGNSPSLAVQCRRLWHGLYTKRWSDLHRLISQKLGCQKRVSNDSGVSKRTVSIDTNLPRNSAPWLGFASIGTRRRHCGYQRDLSGLCWQHKLDRAL